MKTTARNSAYFKRKADKKLFKEFYDVLKERIQNHLSVRAKHNPFTFTPYYILEGHTPKHVDNISEFALYFDTANRVVRKTRIGEAEVSTVFIGMAAAFGFGKPLLFETMIFGGDENGYQERYSTWDEAEQGHQKACELVLRTQA